MSDTVTTTQSRNVFDNKKSLVISGMSCGHCIGAVRSALESIPGIHVEDVSLGGAIISVAGERDTETLRQDLGAALQGEGYELSDLRPDAA